MRLSTFAALLLVAACSGERAQDGDVTPAANDTSESNMVDEVPAEDPDKPATVLTPTGWGPLRIGMTLDEVIAAVGPDSDPKAVGGPEPEQCDQFRPERAPEGLLVMIEDGRLTRISIVDGDLETVHSLGLGATGAAVKARLGEEARVSPHEYVAPVGEYVDIWVAGATGEPYVRDADARGIRYEVGAEGKVEAIHAGGPAIQYVEGCL